MGTGPHTGTITLTPLIYVMPLHNATVKCKYDHLALEKSGLVFFIDIYHEK